jgi:hypothetical protein
MCFSSIAFSIGTSRADSREEIGKNIAACMGNYLFAVELNIASKGPPGQTRNSQNLAKEAENIAIKLIGSSLTKSIAEREARGHREIIEQLKEIQSSRVAPGFNSPSIFDNMQLVYGHLGAFTRNTTSFCPEYIKKYANQIR